MLSQQTKYAVRALIYLSEQPVDQFIKVQRIALDADLPAPYLSKILKQLADSKLLVTRRGANGGVQLNRENGAITFRAVCAAVEDPIVNQECVLLKKTCDKNAPCAFHKKWANTKQQFLEFLSATELYAPKSG